AMNESVAAGTITFGMLHAEKVFKEIYKRFLRDRCTEEAMTRRVQEVVDATVALRAALGIVMSPNNIAHLHAEARTLHEDHQARFEEFRREYFLIDQYPENDERFPINPAGLYGGRRGLGHFTGSARRGTEGHAQQRHTARVEASGSVRSDLKIECPFWTLIEGSPLASEDCAVWREIVGDR
ncbi:MAG TPA: hypothetical protein VIK60_00285, partial [Vicinamibacterales bacterium]